MRTGTQETAKWPKVIPDLTPEQQRALEEWYVLWLERYNKNTFLDRFNYGFPSSLPIAAGCRTLHVGAGVGSHLAHEDLSRQDYHVLELREDFCRKLREMLPQDHVHFGNIEERQSFSDGSFDRVIDVHVSNLRKKLGSTRDGAERIKAIRSVGYVYATPGKLKDR